MYSMYQYINISGLYQWPINSTVCAYVFSIRAFWILFDLCHVATVVEVVHYLSSRYPATVLTLNISMNTGACSDSISVWQYTSKAYSMCVNTAKRSDYKRHAVLKRHSLRHKRIQSCCELREAESNRHTYIVIHTYAIVSFTLHTSR
jgi:hypothetical protein